MCRSKNVWLVQEGSDSDSDGSYVISAISKKHNKKGSQAKVAVTKLLINNKKNENTVNFQIDTGAQCNILPIDTHVKVSGDTQPQSLKPCKKEIVSYTGEPILSLDTSVALARYCEFTSL